MKRPSLLVLVAATTLSTAAAASFTVTKTADSGAGSLRLAILDANGAPGTDTIVFAIPASDSNCDPTTHVCTITATTALPAITDAVVIDGYTQSDASVNTLAVGNNAVLLIQLSGGSSSSAGLVITAGNSTVRGLVINGFSTNGITLQTGGNNVICGDFIGTDPAGVVAKPNDLGVDIIDSANNLIGGPAPPIVSARNLLSENTTAEVVIESGATSNQVEGSYIGPNAGGNTSLSSAGQRSVGIIVRGANNTIGGTAAGAGNLILAMRMKAFSSISRRAPRLWEIVSAPMRIPRAPTPTALAASMVSGPCRSEAVRGASSATPDLAFSSRGDRIMQWEE